MLSSFDASDLTAASLKTTASTYGDKVNSFSEDDLRALPEFKELKVVINKYVKVIKAV